jgi:hypothetical protein
MIEIIISIAILVLSLGLILLSRKINEKWLTITLKTLGILLFIVYFYRLFQRDAIDNINALEGYIAKNQLIFIIILRWLTIASLVVSCSVGFFKISTIRNITAFFVPIVTILNVIFFRLNLLAFLGENYNIISIRAIQFAIEIALTGIIGFYYLYQKINQKDFKKIFSQLKYQIVIFLLLLLTVFPQAFFYNIFGGFTSEPVSFNLTHRIFIYIAFLAPFLIGYFFRNKSYEIRRSVAVMLSIAAFFQYFYVFTFDMGVTGLPFHLCNTAIILMFIAYVFNVKSVFYFTYLVNVSGALFAILFPNTSTAFGTLDVMHFWFNHWYAFFL